MAKHRFLLSSYLVSTCPVVVNGCVHHGCAWLVDTYGSATSALYLPSYITSKVPVAFFLPSLLAHLLRRFSLHLSLPLSLLRSVFQSQSLLASPTTNPTMSGNETAHPSLDDPNAWVPYRYHPNLAAAVLFAVLFGILTISHCVYLGLRRTWYFTPFIIGGLCKSEDVLQANMQELISSASRDHRLCWSCCVGLRYLGAGSIYSAKHLPTGRSRPLCSIDLYHPGPNHSLRKWRASLGHTAQMVDQSLCCW